MFSSQILWELEGESALLQVAIIFNGKREIQKFFVTFYFEIILGLEKSYKNSKSSLCPSVSFL